MIQELIKYPTIKLPLQINHFMKTRKLRLFEKILHQGIFILILIKNRTKGFYKFQCYFLKPEQEVIIKTR